MNETEKKHLLAKEKEYYVKNESLLRAMINWAPKLTNEEVDLHMKACREFLDKYFETYKTIYCPESPFAIKFEEIENAEEKK